MGTMQIWCQRRPILILTVYNFIKSSCQKFSKCISKYIGERLKLGLSFRCSVDVNETIPLHQVECIKHINESAVLLQTH